MKHLVAIGEALIDFTPEQSGVPIRDVEAFSPHVGGAPANVCAAYARLGGRAIMLTQLGNDPFGDKVVQELENQHVETAYIARTDEANTSLAFVALKPDGDREFSFYRKPGADMLYTLAQVPKEVFEGAAFLHFCSVSLGPYPMKEAHKQAIRYAKEQGVVISFDPNLRLQLFGNEENLKRAIADFLPYADIVKLSEEEVNFVTGKSDESEALESLFAMGISIVIITRGADGADLYVQGQSDFQEQAQTSAMNTYLTAHAPGNKAPAVDTTGAGDGFIGSFLGQLAQQGTTLEEWKNYASGQWEEILCHSNVFCGKSVQKKGGMESYPEWNDI